MRSMTGFGLGTAHDDGITVTVEITAVNSKKKGDTRISLAREFSSLDPQLKTRVQKSVHRGTLNVNVQIDQSDEARGQRVCIDRDLAAGLIRELREVAQENGIEERLSVADLLGMPGLIIENNTANLEIIRPVALHALENALEALNSMQCTEGEALKNDLLPRCAELRRLVAVIQAGTDQALMHYRDRLMERIAVLEVKLELDDDRLAREVAFCAEKADINEETVRLQSHLDQFEAHLGEGEDIGRSLEFLCQEMGREISTLCAKTRETSVSEAGLAFRAELARLREQTMNVE
ncbi:MAG: YicC family protein [Lentisphaeria bacterium]|nr:YicC family protein [Lentisphaeria bacterium]